MRGTPHLGSEQRGRCPSLAVPAVAISHRGSTRRCPVRSLAGTVASTHWGYGRQRSLDRSPTGEEGHLSFQLSLESSAVVAIQTAAAKGSSERCSGKTSLDRRLRAAPEMWRILSGPSS